MDFPVKVTDKAVQKAYELLAREGKEGYQLRIAVNAGGCAGLVYNLSFTNVILDNDLIEDFGEIEVVVDQMSAPYLTGAVIDYEDSLQKSGFNINNPNSASSCACGDSFS